MYFWMEIGFLVDNCFYGLRVSDVEAKWGQVCQVFWDFVHRTVLEIKKIQIEKAVFINYYCIYEDEVRARPSVQINGMKTKLKLIAIDHARAADCHWGHKLGDAILFSYSMTSASICRTRSFVNLMRSLLSKDLKSAWMEEPVGKTDIKIDEGKALVWETDCERKQIKGKSW